MLGDLRKLNFEYLIKINFDDIPNYSFKKYLEKGQEHILKGFCTSCEEKGINTANDNIEFKLQTMSHGAHSIDFLESIIKTTDTSTWHEEPILFIAESPSTVYPFYKPMPYNGITKKPTSEWYWVHHVQNEVFTYPAKFDKGEYGDFFCSIINTFQLKNTYFTNLIKCGLNDDKGKFENILKFKSECIQNCFDNYLKKELEIFKPKLVFTIGNNTDNTFRELTNDEFKAVSLPHPSSRGLRKDFYRTMAFWTIAKALYSKEILQKDKVAELLDLYLLK